MVLSFSRQCVGLLHTSTSSRLAPVSLSPLGRRYAGASAAATKTKGRPTSKTSTKHAQLKTATTPKTSTKAQAISASTVASSPTSSPTATSTSKPVEKPNPKQPAEDQVEQLEQMLLMSQLSNIDPWGQTVVETLDVMIPRTGGMFDGSKIKHNASNTIKNAVALYAMAGVNAIPGFDFSEATWKDRWLKWPARMFSTSSVKPGAWLTPFREDALEAYKELNAAIASGDKKTAKALTTFNHAKRVAELLNKGRKGGDKYIWRFHKEVSPTQVVSIRTVEGYLADEDPKIGNRLLVHALVKFDTEQSLEIYDKSGNPLHQVRPGAQRNSKGYVPAVPRRVTEYLVMEKRMWYDMPWQFRDQMWDTSSNSTA